jgi:hypothetical protein
MTLYKTMSKLASLSASYETISIGIGINMVPCFLSGIPISVLNY